jgi:hypothetical protein
MRPPAVTPPPQLTAWLVRLRRPMVAGAAAPDGRDEAPLEANSGSGEGSPGDGGASVCARGNPEAVLSPVSAAREFEAASRRLNQAGAAASALCGAAMPWTPTSTRLRWLSLGRLETAALRLMAAACFFCSGDDGASEEGELGQ